MPRDLSNCRDTAPDNPVYSALHIEYCIEAHLSPLRF